MIKKWAKGPQCKYTAWTRGNDYHDKTVFIKHEEYASLFLRHYKPFQHNWQGTYIKVENLQWECHIWDNMYLAELAC